MSLEFTAKIRLKCKYRHHQYVGGKLLLIGKQTQDIRRRLTVDAVLGSVRWNFSIRRTLMMVVYLPFHVGTNAVCSVKIGNALQVGVGTYAGDRIPLLAAQPTNVQSTHKGCIFKRKICIFSLRRRANVAWVWQSDEFICSGEALLILTIYYVEWCGGPLWLRLFTYHLSQHLFLLSVWYCVSTASGQQDDK